MLPHHGYQYYECLGSTTVVFVILNFLDCFFVCFGFFKNMSNTSISITSNLGWMICNNIMDFDLARDLLYQVQIDFAKRSDIYNGCGTFLTIHHTQSYQVRGFIAINNVCMYVCVFAQTPSFGFNAHILAHSLQPIQSKKDIMWHISGGQFTFNLQCNYWFSERLFLLLLLTLCNTVILQLVIL